MSMPPLLKNIKLPYVRSHNLSPFLTDYAKPRDFVARLVENGELIRLKNGFFVIAERIEDQPVPFEQIGNLLYGPSYVSLEWALSYYGMIPEGVYVVTCVTVNQSKKFQTPLGSFTYQYLNHFRYSIGIDQKENGSGRFLMATPEKALADLVHFKAKKLSREDLLIDLIEGRRIEEDELRALNQKHLQEIAENYGSQSIYTLIQALRLL